MHILPILRLSADLIYVLKMSLVGILLMIHELTKFQISYRELYQNYGSVQKMAPSADRSDAVEFALAVHGSTLHLCSLTLEGDNSTLVEHKFTDPEYRFDQTVGTNH